MFQFYLGAFVIWAFCLLHAIGDDDGSAHTLINAVQTECEYQSLTVGTRLGDAFNSFDEESKEDRLHHDYMFNQDPHNAAFIKILHSDRRRRHYSWGLQQIGSKGKPLNRNHSSNNLHSNVTHIADVSGHHRHQSNGDRIHHHTNASSSIFKDLGGKSIYLLGDSTLLPIYRALISPIHSHDPKWDFNVWAKEKCLSLSGESISSSTNPHGFSLSDNSLCRSVGYRSSHDGEGEILFERQDYLIEKLESGFIYNHSFLNHRHKPRPDILILQLGRMSCLHAFNSSNPTEQQKNQPKTSENMIHTFMKAIKDVVSAKAAKTDVNTTVILSLAPRNHLWLNNPGSNVCTWHMNRIFAFGAHYQGFLVLEREEIEQRLMFKSEHSPHPFIHASVPLLETPPVPQILATSLLTMYSCAKANRTFSF